MPCYKERRRLGFESASLDMVDFSANLAQFKRHMFKPIKDGAYVIFCDVFHLRI